MYCYHAVTLMEVKLEPWERNNTKTKQRNADPCPPRERVCGLQPRRTHTTTPDTHNHAGHTQPRRTHTTTCSLTDRTHKAKRRSVSPSGVRGLQPRRTQLNFVCVMCVSDYSRLQQIILSCQQPVYVIQKYQLSSLGTLTEVLLKKVPGTRYRVLFLQMETP